MLDSVYFVDLSATGTSHAGTPKDPFSYEDFSNIVGPSTDDELFYFKGQYTITSASPAFNTGGGNKRIIAWDLEEFGPWRLKVEDFSKFSLGSTFIIEDGILLIDDTGDISFDLFQLENVYLYRKTSTITDKFILGGSAASNIYMSTVQIDGILEYDTGSITTSCLKVENGISIPSTASTAALTYSTYNGDSTAVTPDPGFSGYFNFANNQDLFDFTGITDINDDPQFPSGITVSDPFNDPITFFFDGNPKVRSQGAFYSNGANPIVYVDLNSGVPAGSGTSGSPYNFTQFYSDLDTRSYDTGTIIKLKGMAQTTNYIYIGQRSFEGHLLLERWESSIPWGIHTTDGISNRGISRGGIFKTDADFINTLDLSNTYLEANRVILYSTDRGAKIKGSTVISSGTPTRIGDCYTPEIYLFVDSNYIDSGVADVGSDVFVWYFGLSTAFSQASNSESDFFDPSEGIIKTFQLDDCVFGVTPSVVSFSTTFDENNYLYPSDIYNSITTTSSDYSTKSGYSTGISGNPRYGVGAYYFPEVVASFTASPTSGGIPLEVNFNNDSTGIITEYSWDFGDGTTSTEENPVKTYTSAGTYTVTLTVTGLEGITDTFTRTDYIIAVDSLTAGFSGSPLSGSEPLTVNFTDSSIGDISYRIWNFGDGTALEDVTDPSHTYSNPGTYTVSLTVRDADSNEDTETKTDYVEVSSGPLTANFTGTPQSGEKPLTVNFTDNSAGSITYRLWDFGDGNTQENVTDPSHTYSDSGVYTVSLTIRDASLNQDIKTRTEYITVTEPPLNADFSASPVFGTEPLSVSFTDSSTGDISYRLWTFGDGTSEEDTVNPSHTYTSPGLYTVSLLVRDPSLEEDLETKVNYVTVGEDFIVADKVLMESSNASTGDYWKIYIDDQKRFVFETNVYIWRTVDPQAEIKKWTFIQFLPHKDTMYVGKYSSGWKKVDLVKFINGSPDTPTSTRTYVVPNSTFKIDDIQIWDKEVNKKTHFQQNRGKAGLLDNRS